MENAQTFLNMGTSYNVVGQDDLIALGFNLAIKKKKKKYRKKLAKQKKALARLSDTKEETTDKSKTVQNNNAVIVIVLVNPENIVFEIPNRQENTKVPAYLSLSAKMARNLSTKRQKNV